MRIAAAWFGAVLFAGGAAAAELPPASDFIMPIPCTGKYEAACEYARTVFPAEYERAFQGDYQGQRNVAFCLSSTCDGAIQHKPTLGCAWRIVILASGSPKIDSSDRASYDYECGKLDRTDRATARAQASAIFAAIYRRPLPRGF